MKASKLLKDPWARITPAARRSKGFVAVAYLGKGARSLLPLKAGSVLVVDASEGAVKAGQTYPRELLKYLKAKVEVFSQQDLHAKVFAFADRAFVGSNNASKRSRDDLVEAAFQLNGKGAVAEARAFVKELAITPLGARYLEQLQEIYRPPRLPGGKPRSSVQKLPRLTRLRGAARLRVVKLVTGSWSEPEKRAAAKAGAAAKKLKTHDWKIDKYSWFVRQRGFKRGDQVLQIVDDNGAVWLEPPGNVLWVEPVEGAKKVMVAIEVPPRNRKRLSIVQHRLPAATRKRIKRDGPVNAWHAAALRGLWHI